MRRRFHDRRGADGTRRHVLGRPGTSIDVDHGWGDVETGQLRDRDVVVVVIRVIRVVVVFIGANSTIVFIGWPGEMGAEGTNTFRLA